MKLLTVLEARPQFIKCTPIYRAIRLNNAVVGDDSLSISEVIVQSGQYYDYTMSTCF